MKVERDRPSGSSISIAVLFSIQSAVALGQVHFTGFNLQKTCPISATPGQAFQCQVLVRNNDDQHGVANLAVTNQVPYPGGTTTSIPCLQNGAPVTSLGALGSGSETCTGAIDEVGPACATNGLYFDQVVVTATDADPGQYNGLPVSSSVTNAVSVPSCGAHVTGFNMTKTCPISVASGASFQCTFTVENNDDQHGVSNLAVANTVPYPGGSTTPVACLRNGNPVTSLGVAGTATDSCAGSIDETAPVSCSGTVNYVDQVSASGTDAGTGVLVNASATNAVPVQPRGSGAPGPHVTGFNMQLNCPIQVASGADFQCSYVIQNSDTQHEALNLSFTSRFPLSGGTNVPQSCLQNGTPVTTLGWKGSATDTCTGTVNVTAPVNCSGTTQNFAGQLQAAGIDGCFGFAVNATVTNAVPVAPQACTLPTPSGTDVAVDFGKVSVVFDAVSANGGSTTINPIDPATAGTLPAGGYTISGLGIAYEITTTAPFSPPITVGFVLPGTVDLVTFNALRVLHGEGSGSLVDRTYFSPAGCVDAPGSPCPAPNFATRTIYAQVDSLSPLLIASFAAPSVQTITVPADPVAVGTTVSVEGTFTDPGTHTATWAWGDGTTSPGTVVESGGFGTVTGSHVYTAAGVYRLTLTVTDEGGAQGEKVSDFLVVYDPSGGFVTGAGWISSPAGAYAADVSLAGKASFGFVSKYVRNATVPSGDTQFQFASANFRFDSDAYEWMVISGAKARYRGVGKVNGSGSYGFELTAWDGQVSGGGNVDRFRVKIWDVNHGNGVVYDNQMGAVDGADPTTALGGGSIVIHKK